MSIEEKYLSKNYNISNNIFLKTNGEKVSWFYVVSDVKNTFSYNITLAEYVINNWCVSQKIEPKDVLPKNLRYYGVMMGDDFEYIFPIKNFVCQSSKPEEYIEHGFKRQMLRTKLPEYELTLQLKQNEMGDDFTTFIGEMSMLVFYQQNSKFNLTIIDVERNVRYSAENSILASFSTGVNSIYDDDYLGQDFQIELRIKPDLFKVEY